MPKILIVSLFILTAIVPATTKAYSNEQFRLDVKTYLDLQTKYQQDQIFQQKIQSTLNGLNSTYDSLRIQQLMEQQQALYEKQKQQIEELNQLQAQITAHQEQAQPASTPQPVQCVSLVKGSYMNDKGVCACPTGTEYAHDGSEELRCVKVETKVTKPVQDAPTALDKLLQASEVHDKSVVTTPLPAPIPAPEKPSRIKSFFRSIGHFFSNLF